WEWFQSEKVATGKSEKVDHPPLQGSFILSRFHFSVFFVGLLAGMLPLVHLHSLVVLFVVTVFLLGLDPENWRSWIAFGVGVCIVAIAELAWSVTGTASHASQFIDWHFGWDKHDSDIFWFWFKNTGLVIPMTALGLYLHLRRPKGDEGRDADRQKLRQFYTP